PRAARSNFMTPTFRTIRSAATCRSASDLRAEPVADAAKRDHVDREYRATQQRHLLLESRALRTARRGVARAKSALDECKQRSIAPRRQDETDDRAKEPGERKIDHAVSSSFRDRKILQDAGDDRHHRERQRQEHFPAQLHELIIAIARHDRL